MSHVLLEIEATVNETHKGMGGLVSTLLLVAQARKCMLIVAPAGTGKSTATATLKDILGNVRLLDSVTRNGLQGLASEFNGFTGLVSIDDLGKIDTFYSRLATITTFVELCYSHFVEKHAQGVNLAISDFNGSAVLNCQPGVFRRVVQTGEWEATIMDKSLRYYHLWRAVEPQRELPKLPIDKVPSIAMTEAPKLEGPKWELLFRLGLVQWSRARTYEHMADYLRASASLDGRHHVDDSDYDTVLHLLRPMILERVLMTKTDLEGGRDFNANLLCLAVEFTTYGTFPLDILAENYKISNATAIQIMRQSQRYAHMLETSPITVQPTPEMQRIMDVLQAEAPKGDSKVGRNTGNTRGKRAKGSPKGQVGTQANIAPMVEASEPVEAPSGDSANGATSYRRYSDINRP